MTAPDFDRAYRFTRGQEGGYWPGGASDPNPTDRGVTQRVYDQFRVDRSEAPRPIREMTEEECRIIYEDYWHRAHADQMPSADVALCHFDMAFNAGVEAAAELLQRVVGTPVDGRIGPQTLGAVRQAAMDDHKALLVRLTGARVGRYRRLAERRPNLAPNLKGWLNRVSALQKAVGL